MVERPDQLILEREKLVVSVGAEHSHGGPLADVSIHLAPAMTAELDAWIATLPSRVSRPQAIRAILAASLAMMKADAEPYPMCGPDPPL